MKKLLFSAILLAGLSATAQVKVGDNPTTINSSALLEMESTSKGLLMSRMTTAQRTAIASPANGLQVFDTDTKSFWHFDATVLPAPGKWVEGTSSKNGEWAFDDINTVSLRRATVADATNDSVMFTSTGKLYIGNNLKTLGYETTGNNIIVQNLEKTYAKPIQVSIRNLNNVSNQAYALFAAEVDSATVFVGSHGSARTLTRMGKSVKNSSELVAIKGDLSIGTFVSGKHIYFGTSNVNRGILTSSGDWGIGTQIPTHKLDVRGKLRVDASEMILGIDTGRNAANALRIEPRAGTNLAANLALMPSGTATDSTIRFYNSSDPANTGAVQFSYGTNRLSLQTLTWGTGVAASKFFINGLKVGINVADPINSLDVAGGVAIGSYAGNNTIGSGSLALPSNLFLGTPTTLGNKISITGAGFASTGIAFQSTYLGNTNIFQIGVRGINATENNWTLENNSAQGIIMAHFTSRNVAIGYANSYKVPATRLDVDGYIKVGSTDTTGNATPVAGMIRYNSTSNKFEGYTLDSNGDGTADDANWVPLH